MKKILLPICLFFAIVSAQGQAIEGTVEYQKIQQPAAVLELAYNPDIVEGAMNDYLSKKGRSKANDIKGFTTYRNTQPSQNDNLNADLYFKVERKSRKEKEVSTISLLLYPVNKTESANGQENHFTMEQAKEFLNQLVPVIDAYNLELLIKEQNAAVSKAESKYKDLVSDGAGLEKDKSKIEQKILDNKQDQNKQSLEVEHQKQELSNLVNKRKQ
ncbi:MAG: hypothetical protein ABIO04_11275 [Ferruginibacter sp.]